MKVLVVTNMYPYKEDPSWGIFIKTQTDSLIEKGVEVDLLVIHGGKTKIDYLFAIFRLWKYCWRQDYDLVHAHNGLAGLAARCQFAAPLVVSFVGDDLYGHSDSEGQPTRTSLFWVWLHKILARHVDDIIVKSRGMAQLISDSPSHVIPNGVNMDVFKLLSKEDCRERLGLKPDGSYILFPYIPSEIRKNYVAVEAAVEMLNKRHGLDVEILVVYNQDMKTMPLYLNAADAVVLVSFWEGSPNIIKEAMACNAPIVSADVGDVREIITDVDGCYLTERDPEAISKALRTALLRGKRTHGREAIQHLSLENVANQVLAVYEKVICSQK